jgi:hypothetical protein
MVELDYEAFAKRTNDELHFVPVLQFDEVLDQVEIPPGGLWLEFGVGPGNTLKVLAEKRGSARLVGFDSFKGLPEYWRPGYGVGHFAQDPIEVPGAEVVVGLFAETLPRFNFDRPVTLVHIDCDLYSSTCCALRAVEPHLAPGCIIMFDELTTSDGATQHELNALHEAALRGLQYRWVANGKTTLRVEGPLR